MSDPELALLVKILLECCTSSEQRDFVILRARGLTNKEIGREYGITGSAVGYQLRQVAARYDAMRESGHAPPAKPGRNIWKPQLGRLHLRAG